MSDPRPEGNRRRARLAQGGAVGAIALVVFLVLGVVGFPLVGLLLGVALGAVVVAVASRRADAVALAKARAVPSTPADHPRFHNVVEGLAVAAGVPKPSLHVIDDPALNALTVGRSARGASLAVTTGLLETLTRIELEGVIAHELSHIRRLDIVPSTLAVTLVAPLVPSLVPRLAGARRENLADVTGVSLTRYPPGLISALEKVRGAAVVRSSDRSIAHLWLESPAQESDHPPLEERIQALREL